MSSDEFKWKDDICSKLSEVFYDDTEKFFRVNYHLVKEEEAYRNSGGDIGPTWRLLKTTLNLDKAFVRYAEQVAEDTKRAETDKEFQEIMNRINPKMMDHDDAELPKDAHQCFDLAKAADPNLAFNSVCMGIRRGWAMIPVARQMQMLRSVSSMFGKSELMAVADDVVGTVSKTGANIVMVSLAVLSLGYEAIINIQRWWSGTITGKRCCKNILDCFFSVSGGMVGGMVGASVGSVIGPIGTLVGGAVGSVVSSQTINFLSDRLTQLIFGIPKDVALENAYKYFDVKMSASNSEINSAFRKKCLQHHPDKGGDQEEFFMVQMHMAVIKAARKDL